MLGLPKNTECNRQLAKSKIFQAFKLNTAQKEKFDADIKRLAIVNEVSTATMNIEAGNEVKSFFVVLISLRQEAYDEKNIALIAKLVPQNILFVLEFDGKARLAAYRSKLLHTDWKPLDEHAVSLSGLNLDSVWQGIIVQVGGVVITEGSTLDEQLTADEEKAKLLRRVEQLERQARAEKQPKKKFELAQEVLKLRETLEGL